VPLREIRELHGFTHCDTEILASDPGSTFNSAHKAFRVRISPVLSAIVISFRTPDGNRQGRAEVLVRRTPRAKEARLPSLMAYFLTAADTSDTLRFLSTP
jgi:hypothetical protein